MNYCLYILKNLNVFIRPLNDDDIISENEDDAKVLKLTSAKDYFDDEAELSESDWSSDEEHLVDSIDKLEEEAGDKDKLDEDVVKDGLDKIYMCVYYI